MNPLQQGLKLIPCGFSLSVCRCCNNESTTTRIETDRLIWLNLRAGVAIMNPLQQGLKLISCVAPYLLHDVAIMNPLQQGLKLSKMFHHQIVCFCCNNESTTTRIETS